MSVRYRILRVYVLIYKAQLYDYARMICVTEHYI